VQGRHRVPAPAGSGDSTTEDTKVHRGSAGRAMRCTLDTQHTASNRQIGRSSSVYLLSSVVNCPRVRRPTARDTSLLCATPPADAAAHTRRGPREPSATIPHRTDQVPNHPPSNRPLLRQNGPHSGQAVRNAALARRRAATFRDVGRLGGGWFGTWSVGRGMLPIRPRVRLGAILLGRCRGGTACPLRPEPEIRPRRTRWYTEDRPDRPCEAPSTRNTRHPTARSADPPRCTSCPLW
jgi:hypothetical protein